MRGRTITVTDRGATIVLRGYGVAEIARHAGVRPIYSGVAQGWVADAHRLGDFLAFCQSRNIVVDVEGTRSSAAGLLVGDQFDQRRGDQLDVRALDVEPDLFSDGAA